MAKQVIDVEDLLRWAYQAQQVHRASVATAEGCLAVAARGIPTGEPCGDSGAARLVYGSPVHIDADTIHAAVMRPASMGGLHSVARGLVIHHAAGGGRPDWMPGARPLLVPMMNGRGQPSAIYDGNGRRVGHRVMQAVAVLDTATACEVIHRGMPHEQITFTRAAYTAWHAALVWLAAELRRVGLEDSIAQDPRAPGAPWSTVRGALDFAKTA